MIVVYDNECPFCRDFAALARIRAEAGEEVTLVGARSDHPEAARARAGYDLNDGMLVVYRGRDHYGAEAVRLLAELSGEEGRGGWLSLLRGRRAHAAYPLLKAGRRLYLRMAGKPRID